MLLWVPPSIACDVMSIPPPFSRKPPLSVAKVNSSHAGSIKMRRTGCKVGLDIKLSLQMCIAFQRWTLIFVAGEGRGRRLHEPRAEARHRRRLQVPWRSCQWGGGKSIFFESLNPFSWVWTHFCRRPDGQREAIHLHQTSPKNSKIWIICPIWYNTKLLGIEIY